MADEGVPGGWVESVPLGGPLGVPKPKPGPEALEEGARPRGRAGWEISPGMVVRGKGTGKRDGKKKRKGMDERVPCRGGLRGRERESVHLHCPTITSPFSYIVHHPTQQIASIVSHHSSLTTPATPTPPKRTHQLRGNSSRMVGINHRQHLAPRRDVRRRQRGVDLRRDGEEEDGALD